MTKPDRSTEKYEMTFFNMPLEKFIDKQHELVLLGDKIDWHRLEEMFDEYYNDKGRKAISTRLMLGLLLLKYMKNLSDEAVCDMWIENPYFQYFCGEKLFQYKLPMDRSSISRWRKRVDLEKLEKILQESLYVAYSTKALSPSDVHKVAIDTTVQEKAVDYPNEIKLFLDGILDLGRSAKRAGLKLKQNYRFIAKALAVKASGYAHARQMNRLKKAKSTMRKLMFKLKSRIENALARSGKTIEEMSDHLNERLIRSAKILFQKKTDKDQLLVWHAPEVECIAKGKARSPYEFGCKVSLAINVNPGKAGHFILSSRVLHGKPYDGHTLNSTIKNVEEITGATISKAYVDEGYKGHDYENKERVYRSRQKRGVFGIIKKELKRRSAIEPIIGHAKHDHRMDKCHLKGKKGDQINAIFAAIGFNFKQILNWLVVVYCICINFLISEQKNYQPA
jgi:transposase, IS5 family